MRNPEIKRTPTDVDQAPQIMYGDWRSDQMGHRRARGHKDSKERIVDLGEDADLRRPMI